MKENKGGGMDDMPIFDLRPSAFTGIFRNGEAGKAIQKAGRKIT
jgi:hypothetical protein